MNPTCLLLGFLLLGSQIAAQTLNFEPPMTPGLVAATVNPEGWTCAQGGIVLPALGLPGPTSGFPTSGSQWGYLEPGTTTLGTSVPPGGPAPYPFTPSQTGHLRVPLAIPATTSPIELTIRWTYVNREGLQETTYNDFFTADLTNGAGVVLQSLLYRDTFSNFAAGVTPSAAGGSPGPHEIAPAGAPKISTFQIDPMLAGNPTVTLEFHVGNAADASVDGYAHIDQIQLQVLAPTYPGSGLDFALTTGVNGPLTSVDRKAVAVGDTVTLHFDSPGGTFDGRPFILASQTFAVGSYSGPTAGLSDIAINVALPFFVWSGLPGAPLGTFPLPTSGYTLPSQGFPGLEGLAFLFQGVVLSPVVANGYATSDGHELYYPARVYVSSTTGSSLGSGAASSPLASVSQAYALAKTLGNANLAIAAGTYSVNDLVLDAPIGFDGGLDSQTWQRASGQYSLLVTNHRGLRVVDVAAARFSGIDIRASDAPSLTSATASTREAASIALEVWGSGNGVRFEDCRFQAGRGANGVPGSNGTTVGSDGQTGGSGSAGYLVFTSNSGPAGGSGGSGARNGGTGGQGGRVTCVPGIFGACTSGSPAAGGGGGAGVGSGNNGGSGGNPATCNVATDGAGGNPGPVGSDGITGSPAATPGGFVGADGSWRPSLATDGANGVPGGGGGGGGGGGCGTCATQFVTGGSGGGGGGGGGGGSGGKGGSEGGASFAVYLREASPTFVACTFVAGQGGTGGAGGHGRNGGQGAGGGVGGNGVNVTVAGVGLGSGDGGQGGAGGPGGAGGGGGGAHGGPSFCVFQSGSSAPLGLTGPGQTFQVGLGGFGGLGGATGSTGNTAPSGSIGPAGLLGT